MQYDIRGSHGGEDVSVDVTFCGLSGGYRRFGKYIAPILNPEDWSSMFLGKLVIHLQVHTASQHRDHKLLFSTVFLLYMPSPRVWCYCIGLSAIKYSDKCMFSWIRVGQRIRFGYIAIVWMNPRDGVSWCGISADSCLAITGCCVPPPQVCRHVAPNPSPVAEASACHVSQRRRLGRDGKTCATLT